MYKQGKGRLSYFDVHPLIPRAPSLREAPSFGGTDSLAVSSVTAPERPVLSPADRSPEDASGPSTESSATEKACGVARLPPEACLR